MTEKDDRKDTLEKNMVDKEVWGQGRGMREKKFRAMIGGKRI